MTTRAAKTQAKPTEQVEPKVAEEVEAPLKPKVVIYTSPSCGPCRNLKPMLTALATQRNFELEIVELSDATRPLFAEHGIRNVPVTMLVEGKSGKEMARITGGMTQTYLENQLTNWEL